MINNNVSILYFDAAIHTVHKPQQETKQMDFCSPSGKSFQFKSGELGVPSFKQNKKNKK